MDKAELLSTLNGHTAKYEQHRQYIEKAKSQAAKFSSGVVEKVILDHEIKSVEVADKVSPLLPTLRELTTALEADKAGIAASKGGVDEQLQELELRQLIGEISDADFDAQTTDLRANAAGANERIAAIDADLAELNGALERWVTLASPAGHYTAPAVVEAAAAADAPAEDDISYHEAGEAREDLSAVFAEPAPATARVDAGDDIAIEAGEMGEEVADMVSAEVHFSGGAEVEIEIGVGDEAAPAVAPVVAVESESEVLVEAAAIEPVSEARADEGVARRALLIYQESTAEEQIYPFTGDQLTIGRGRENDIQIKNDSKVSRYHCKLFRRGNNFYVEDIKSSNGTLVNGELITDRRLFGGEEIVVGETYFRFRIME